MKSFEASGNHDDLDPRDIDALMSGVEEHLRIAAKHNYPYFERQDHQSYVLDTWLRDLSDLGITSEQT